MCSRNPKIHRCLYCEHPFCCSVCGQDFIRKSELKSHMVRHSDERPYACHLCGKRFKRKNWLKTHSIIHLADV
ncbi:Zinc finger protein Gfi-1 like protein [Argiope bruennichi]|uniref:Zinc finger protein Gfi-1 like protein n=1 Tax=Argiope bruennichi TaxID=94029 RepID=A0A8T0E7B3_ARGBR|nr:Zinc finger protein Gfi-1 like protein [Argiope bruennichi]